MAIDFTPTQYIDSGAGPGNALGTTNTVTFSTFVQFDNTTSNQGLFHIGTFAGAIGKFDLWLNVNLLQFRCVSTGTFYITYGFTSTALTHIVARLDGTNGKMFVNGVEVATAAYSTMQDYSSLKTMTAAIINNTVVLNGKMFDARLYDRSLSTAEINTIYKSKGSDNIVNGLVLRQIMKGKDGATVSSVTDYSKNGFTSSITGSPVYYAMPQRLIK